MRSLRCLARIELERLKALPSHLGILAFDATSTRAGDDVASVTKRHGFSQTLGRGPWVMPYTFPSGARKWTQATSSDGTRRRLSESPNMDMFL